MDKAYLPKPLLKDAVKAYFTEEQYEKYGALVCGERQPKLCLWAAFAGPFWFLFHRMYLEATLCFLAFHWGNKALTVLAKNGLMSFMQVEVIGLIIFSVGTAYVAEPLLKRFVQKRLNNLWQVESGDEDSYFASLSATKSHINQRFVTIVTCVILLILTAMIFYIYQLNPDMFLQAFKSAAIQQGLISE